MSVSIRLPSVGELIVEKLECKGINASFKLGVDFSFKEDVSKMTSGRPVLCCADLILV